MKRFFLTLFVSGILFFSCNSKLSKEEVTTSELSDAGAGQTEQTLPAPVAEEEQSPQDTIPSAPKIVLPAVVDHNWDRKIVKTATVRLQVKDFKKYDEHIHSVIEKFGGYVAKEIQDLTEYSSQNCISVKVPVASFSDMLNALPLGDSKTLQREISTNDVTAEFVDIKSRLEAKKQMRLKYLEFLQRAKNMREALEVQQEINGIQEEMDAVSGRLKFLSHSTALSTINLTYFQPLDGYREPESNNGFATRFAAAFRTGGKWAAELIIGLVSIWPLIFGIIIFVLFFKRMRNGKFSFAGKK